MDEAWFCCMHIADFCFWIVLQKPGCCLQQPQTGTAQAVQPLQMPETGGHERVHLVSPPLGHHYTYQFLMLSLELGTCHDLQASGCQMLSICCHAPVASVAVMSCMDCQLPNS